MNKKKDKCARCRADLGGTIAEGVYEAALGKWSTVNGQKDGLEKPLLVIDLCEGCAMAMHEGMLKITEGIKQ